MKKLTLSLAFGLAILFASAQNFGLSVSRGMTALHPTFEAITSSMNQGLMLGAYHIKPLSNGLSFSTGFRFTQFNTAGNVLSKAGNYKAVPSSFAFFQIPLTLEKEMFILSRRARKAAFFRIGLGGSIGYAKNASNQALRRGGSAATMPAVNHGLHASLQLVKNLTWHSEFAFGLIAQCSSTGNEHVPYASFVGVKLDFRRSN